VHTLASLDFARAAQFGPLYGAVDRLVFALALPLWRFGTRVPGVLLGGCHSAQADVVHVYAHSIALNRSYHSAVSCAGCCARAPAMLHAFLDLVQGSLHIVAPETGSAGAHLVHSVALEDWDIELQMPSGAGPPAFSHDQLPGGGAGLAGSADGTLVVRLAGPSGLYRIVALEAHPTRVYPSRASGFPRTQVFALWQDPGQPWRGQLRLHHAAGDTTGSSMLVLVDYEAISAQVREQLLREHFRAASMHAAQFQLLPADFAVLNAWEFDAATPEQALPASLYLVLACGTVGAADARLYVHVQVDVHAGAVVARAVSVLGAHAVQGQSGQPRFALVLAPRHAHEEHRNVVVAASRLVEVHRAGARHTLKVMQVRCVACGDGDGRTYEPGADRCSCGAGSVSVCVPCVDAYACSVERFTFDRATMLDSVNCSVRPRAGAGATSFYELCMPCQQHGGVFCPDGRAFELCPAAQPVARAAGAAGPGGCTCAPGAKNAPLAPHAVGPGSVAFLECQAEPCAQACAPCGAGELCNAALPAHLRAVACPANSVGVAAAAALSRFEGNLTQTCECAPGFARVGTALRFETGAPALDVNVYAAEWDPHDEALFRTTRFGLDVSECELCPAGHFCRRGVARACHAHSVSASGQAACLCVPGYHQWSAEGGCQACPPGHVCPDGAATPCAGVPDRARRAGHPEAFCPCTGAAASYYDSGGGGACRPCPAGFYCTPFALLPAPADALAVNVPVRCPAGSVSPAQSTHVGACLCAAAAHYMSAEAPAGCRPCAAGTYCAQNLQLPCPPGTDSAAGSAGRGSCACTRSGAVLLGDACVCRAGFRADGEACVPCGYPASARELGALDCARCRAGYFRTGVLPNREVLAHLDAYSDHPLSAQQRVAASAYFAQHGAELRSPEAHARRCLLCPPGFVCLDSAVSVPAARAEGAFYYALPAGVPTPARWLEACPRRLEASTETARARALVMLGSCFPSTGTWQWCVPSRARLYASLSACLSRPLARVSMPLFLHASRCMPRAACCFVTPCAPRRQGAPRDAERAAEHAVSGHRALQRVAEHDPAVLYCKQAHGGGAVRESLLGQGGGVRDARARQRPDCPLHEHRRAGAHAGQRRGV